MSLATEIDVTWKMGEETICQQVAEVLQSFRHHFLLKRENAWVVVGPKAVVEKATELGPSGNAQSSVELSRSSAEAQPRVRRRARLNAIEP